MMCKSGRVEFQSVSPGRRRSREGNATDYIRKTVRRKLSCSLNRPMIFLQFNYSNPAKQITT